MKQMNNFKLSTLCREKNIQNNPKILYSNKTGEIESYIITFEHNATRHLISMRFVGILSEFPEKLKEHMEYAIDFYKTIERTNDILKQRLYVIDILYIVFNYKIKSDESECLRNTREKMDTKLLKLSQEHNDSFQLINNEMLSIENLEELFGKGNA